VPFEEAARRFLRLGEQKRTGHRAPTLAPSAPHRQMSFAASL
jgi:hypothetical protein